jgi:phosphonate transport system ATP-binding protein
MRLLIEVCNERGLAAVVNIHDVGLAQMFLPRIVGLRAGEVVYDGPSAGLSADILTRIYGEEDWTSAAAAAGDDDGDAAGALRVVTERRIVAGAG